MRIATRLRARTTLAIIRRDFVSRSITTDSAARTDHAVSVVIFKERQRQMANESSSAKRAPIPQRGPQAPRFIVIEGPLRVGKTTLAKVLAERLHARRV